VSRGVILPLGAAILLLLGSCGSGSTSRPPGSQAQANRHHKGSANPLPQDFFRGCPRTPRCVARAERIRFPPHDAVLRPRVAGYASPEIPGRCGSFADPFDSYWVTVGQRHTSCATAFRVMHALFWRTEKAHGVGVFTITDFPGWRCSQGAGFGQCAKGSQVATWGIQNMFRRIPGLPASAISN
jgi:hypothetical protein